MKKMFFAAAAATAMISTAAIAAVTFDASTGTGFVGKGDVQLALNMNNKQIQDATISIRSNAVVVSEASWTCTNANNGNIQERARITTTSIQGVVTTTERVRNQVTGYKLEGYSGTPTETSTTEGPKLLSCPNNHSTFGLDGPAEIDESASYTQLEASAGAGWARIAQ